MASDNEIQHTRGGSKRLGSLVDLKDISITDAIRQRGGGQSQINQLGVAQK